MLAVTEAAIARLSQVLGQAGVSENVAVRLSDAERPGDSAFQHNGRTVLVLDGRVSELLSASRLDVDGDRFTVRKALSSS